jgi:parvulin-like peptidyl-prolyl cis-trans isomerase-like protein
MIDLKMMKTCLLLPTLAALLSAQTPAPAPLNPGTVVAKVDGKDVTAGEVTAMLQHSGDPRMIQAFQQNPKYIVQQLYMMRFLAAQGEQAKLGERSPLKEELEMIRMNAIAVAMVNQERDGYTVTREAIDAFYAKNQSRYQQAKIKVIFIRFKPGTPATATPQSVEDAAKAAFESAHNPDARTEADAKKLAADVVAKIRGGADFVKLVSDASEDPASKAAGGDFGVVKATSSYPDEIKRAVLALKPGDVSDPVRQPNGFYIIRVEETSVQPVGEVTEPIIQEIRQSHLNDFMNNLTKRFEPAIENQQFFDQPGRVLQPNK